MYDIEPRPEFLVQSVRFWYSSNTHLLQSQPPPHRWPLPPSWFHLVVLLASPTSQQLVDHGHFELEVVHQRQLGGGRGHGLGGGHLCRCLTVSIGRVSHFSGSSVGVSGSALRPNVTVNVSIGPRFLITTVVNVRCHRRGLDLTIWFRVHEGQGLIYQLS